MTARLRHLLLIVLIAASQFFIFEVALRTWGHSEAAPSFQGLFEQDPVIGYRLHPNARTRYVTAEFDTTIAINPQGVRDDSPIGPKAADERRIVVLGDSLVLSVQVEARQTFCALLQERLNRRGGPIRYRVINAGVQGYGPVEDLLFYDRVAAALQPDLVIAALFVGNDAEDAFKSAPRLDPSRPVADVTSEQLVNRLRRLVRRSMVLQVLRLRVVAVTDRLPSRRTAALPEAPLQSYAVKPAPRITEGLQITARCMDTLRQHASASGARTAIMLVPARFQVDEADYGRLVDIVRQSGGTLIRDAASDRFASALKPLDLPTFDVLPALRAALPGSDLFFQQTVHLTPRGHEVTAAALERFIREQGLVDGL